MKEKKIFIIAILSLVIICSTIFYFFNRDSKEDIQIKKETTNFLTVLTNFSYAKEELDDILKKPETFDKMYHERARKNIEMLPLELIYHGKSVDERATEQPGTESPYSFHYFLTWDFKDVNFKKIEKDKENAKIFFDLTLNFTDYTFEGKVRKTTETFKDLQVTMNLKNRKFLIEKATAKEMAQLFSTWGKETGLKLDFWGTLSEAMLG